MPLWFFVKRSLLHPPLPLCQFWDEFWEEHSIFGTFYKPEQAHQAVERILQDPENVQFLELLASLRGETVGRFKGKLQVSGQSQVRAGGSGKNAQCEEAEQEEGKAEKEAKKEKS